MNKYSYYTPIKLAEGIIKLIPKQRYNSVIDICCGTWNLLSAAQKQYPDAQFCGVDIDKAVENTVIKGSKFILSDGRKFSDEEIRDGRTYDLILSNPPFGNMSEDEIYWGHENEDKEFSALRCKRYESEMVLANINLAHDNSVLVFILPITFVNGESYMKARKQIARRFAILEIIELPTDAFEGSNLKTVAIIMKKTETNESTNYRKATLKNNVWKFNLVKKISGIEVKKGNWLGEKIKETKIQIKRGNIHSGEMNNGDNMVLHCSSSYEKGEWKPSIRYTSQVTSIYAEQGDIIINRIGRGVGYWCINGVDKVGISDCLFVIKNSDKKVIEKLLDNTVDGRLNIPSRGVSTRYITQRDICNLIE